MDTELKSSEVTVGTSLPEVRKVIRQENINLYAKASRDFNPIHLDEAFAKKTPLGGTVAHGMLILAYVSQMMAVAFGLDWLASGRLNVRFKAPARPGDTLTVSGKVRRIEKGEPHTMIDCEVLCKNQRGEAVVTGEASVEVR